MLIIHSKNVLCCGNLTFDPIPRNSRLKRYRRMYIFWLSCMTQRLPKNIHSTLSTNIQINLNFKIVTHKDHLISYNFKIQIILYILVFNVNFNYTTTGPMTTCALNSNLKLNRISHLLSVDITCTISTFYNLFNYGMVMKTANKMSTYTYCVYY